MRGLVADIAIVSMIMLAFATASGAPAVAPSAAARVDFVGHDARGPLGPGDRVTVSVRGTPQGSATFHILGVATGVGMQETRGGAYQAQAGTYTGTYVVRPGDSVRNAGIFASLTARGTEVVATAPRTITIDGRSPQVTGRYPGPGSKLANARPNIAADFVDVESGIDPASIRLLVNGQNVTARASVSDTSVSYNPAAPFRPGPVRVELIVADRARNTIRGAWIFQVLPPAGDISAVTVNPATALTTDDVLTVVVAATPGGTATFSVAGVRGNWPMKESGTKGIYFGTILVRQPKPIFGAQLLAAFKKDGRRSTLAAAVPVTFLAAAPAPPTVTTSDRLVSLDEPTSRLALNGASRPGYRVLGRVDYEAQDGAFGGGTLGEFLVVAGPDGTWRATLGRLVPLPQGRLTVTVIAIDQVDRRSPPATLAIVSS